MIHNVDLSDTLTPEELELLEPYFVIHNIPVDANRHNDTVVEAYLLGKVERDNG